MICLVELAFSFVVFVTILSVQEGFGLGFFSKILAMEQIAELVWEVIIMQQ